MKHSVHRAPADHADGAQCEDHDVDECPVVVEELALVDKIPVARRTRYSRGDWSQRCWQGMLAHAGLAFATSVSINASRQFTTATAPMAIVTIFDPINGGP